MTFSRLVPFASPGNARVMLDFLWFVDYVEDRERNAGYPFGDHLEGGYA